MTIHVTKQRVRWRAITLPALLAIPAGAIVLLAMGLPLLDGLRLSLTNWVGFGPADFVGFSNYVEALSTPAVQQSLILTIGYAALVAVGVLVVATLLAAAVSANVRGSAFYRVVWFLPGVAPITASAIFWSIAYQPKIGVVNLLLGALGMGADRAWLADPRVAILPVIATSIWVGVGFAFLLILGATEQIPVEIYEAARVDGASRTAIFFSITLPLIRPVLAITGMLEFIGAANGFGLVYAMTTGGPGNSTQILPILIYDQAFTFGKFGFASAIAIVSGVLLALVGLLALRISRSRQS